MVEAFTYTHAVCGDVSIFIVIRSDSIIANVPFGLYL